MERNKAISTYENEITVCIKDCHPYKKGKKYKIKEVDNDYVTVYYNIIQYEHFPKIIKLEKVLKDYDECENADVKLVLDVTLIPIIKLIYFEDIFITLKEQRKRKIDKINKVKI